MTITEHTWTVRVPADRDHLLCSLVISYNGVSLTPEVVTRRKADSYVDELNVITVV